MKTIKNNFWAAVVTTVAVVVPATLIGINPLVAIAAVVVVAYLSK